ncbi:MAG TPA: membrane protein insertase YidC [Verrucomicrobiae bacterium]|nr:membrane protein insertase YidC [Verrucomicrobiae bacterium]
MDRKTIFIIVACIGLLLGWNALISRLYPPVPVPVQSSTNNVAEVPPVTVAGTNSANAAFSPATSTLGTNIAQLTDTNVAEQTLVVSNENARYTFSTHGGGLKQIDLVGASTSRERRQGVAPTLNAGARIATMAAMDGTMLDGNGVYHLSETPTGVRAEKQLPNGLAIIKEFTIRSNYMVSVALRLQNASQQPIALPEQKWVVGTATPLTPDDDGLTLGIFWSNGETPEDISSGWFANRTLGCFPGTPRTEYRDGQSNVVWAAVHNQFFAIVAMPREPANQIYGRSLLMPPPSAELMRTNSRVVKEPKAYEAALVYAAATLAPGQAIDRHIELYAGPKEYKTLASIAGTHNDMVNVVMGFGGWFGGFFGFFSKMLLLGMNGLHDLLSLPYGWCIIVITVIVKLLFWPLTAASTRSMKRMAALQPQMKAIADKYKEDPVKRNQKTMEFMRENKVNPLGGCLPMLLQMPVFIGFFYMIRSAIELRGAEFLWVPDLSRPDTLFFIPGINFPFNVLPLLMGGTMLWQAHLTPPSPGMDPMQQKIMKYMPLMFMVFLYNYSSGLALYWTVNNLLTILQTKLTKTNPLPTPAPAPALTAHGKKKK